MWLNLIVGDELDFVCIFPPMFPPFLLSFSKTYFYWTEPSATLTESISFILTMKHLYIYIYIYIYICSVYVIFWNFFSYFVSHSWGIPMMKSTGLSHLFKWENVHNWWLTKYFFAPLYIYIYIERERERERKRESTHKNIHKNLMSTRFINKMAILNSELLHYISQQRWGKIFDFEVKVTASLFVYAQTQVM